MYKELTERQQIKLDDLIDQYDEICNQENIAYLQRTDRTQLVAYKRVLLQQLVEFRDTLCDKTDCTHNVCMYVRLLVQFAHIIHAKE